MEYILIKGLCFSIYELTDNEDILSIQEFIKNITQGLFMDDDGYALFIIESDNKQYIIDNIQYMIRHDTCCVNGEYIRGIKSFCKKYKIKKIKWVNK